VSGAATIRDWRTAILTPVCFADLRWEPRLLLR
jgi:hypothetical protein